jgi:dolichyl-phosphate-mannose-protein mannosyltransferase
LSRATGAAVAALLGLFVALVWSAAAQKCETMDEGLFVAGGAAQVRTLDPNIDLTHPPLLRWLAGLPAVAAGARVPQPAPILPRGAMDLYAYQVQEAFDYAQRMLYEPGQDHDRVLRWGRMPFALLGALLGLLVFREARRLGPWRALLAAATLLFLPEVLAHSGWAHSDVASALFTFVVALALARAIERGTRGADVGLGLALGLAAAVKLTGLLLWPAALVVLAVLGGGARRVLRGAGLALLCGLGVLVLAYLPEPRLLGHAFLPADLERLGLSRIEPLLRFVPLPDTLVKGVVHTLLLGERGQPAFLGGAVSTTGWWSYFPVAIFLKYPTGLLLVALPGVVATWRSAQLSRGRKAALTVPPLVVLGSAMAQSVDIGVRSVLPIAPFLALWAAEALAAARTMWRRAALALLATSVLSGLLAWPDFLAWFNPLLGGTQKAGRWLVDSNLDWGQDLPALSRELRRRGIARARLGYFGAGMPAHWGIEADDARTFAEGWYAVSRTYLSGVWPPGDPYGWLRALRPVALVGGSIALFDVRERDVEAAWRRGAGPEVGMALGLIRLGRDPSAAAAAFAEVLAKTPGHYGALFQRAAALDRAGRTADALAAWRAFLPSAETAHDAANAAYARGRIEALGSP